MNRIEVELKDLPAWVQEQSALHVGKNKRPRCFIEPVEKTANVGSTWHDNARQVIVGRNGNGETVTLRGGYYDSIMNFTREELFGYMGGKTDLPIDGAMLQISLFYKGDTITMYIRRDGPYMKLLNGLSDGAELSQIQMAVLNLYVGLTTKGRKDTIARDHIPQSLVNVVTQELVDMGYLKINKAGAVSKTVEGRRMDDQCRMKREWSWYRWSDCYDFRTRRFTGFAAEIIDEYRERMKADIARRKAK